MKLYNKSELRYSRIFFDKKPPAFVFILIISTAIILIGALIGAAYTPKNYIVKAGDVIVSLSSGQEGLQASSLNKQLEKLRAKEAIFQKFEQSLNEKYNHMSNSGEEQEYYGKVEYYLSQLNSENYNNGTQYSKI